MHIQVAGRLVPDLFDLSKADVSKQAFVDAGEALYPWLNYGKAHHIGRSEVVG